MGVCARTCEGAGSFVKLESFIVVFTHCRQRTRRQLVYSITKRRELTAPSYQSCPPQTPCEFPREALLAAPVVQTRYATEMESYPRHHGHQQQVAISHQRYRLQRMSAYHTDAVDTHARTHMHAHTRTHTRTHTDTPAGPRTATTPPAGRCPLPQRCRSWRLEPSTGSRNFPMRRRTAQ